MNLPNKLTLSRLLAVAVITIMYMVFGPVAWNLFTIFALFIIASFTDFLDGKIARKYNLVTGFGKLMDPLADKMIVITLVIILMDLNAFTFPNGNTQVFSKIALVSLIIIVFRELFVSGVRLIALEQGGEVVAANIYGKAKTMTQMISLSLLSFTIALSKLVNNTFVSILFYISIILFYISIILLIISGIDIFVKNKKYFKVK